MRGEKAKGEQRVGGKKTRQKCTKLDKTFGEIKPYPLNRKKNRIYCIFHLLLLRRNPKKKIPLKATYFFLLRNFPPIFIYYCALITKKRGLRGKMGCGASTNSERPESDGSHTSNAYSTSAPPVSEDDLSAADDAQQELIHQQQVEEIRKRRPRQTILSSEPDSLEHYRFTTFSINDNDLYYCKPEEGIHVVSSPVTLRSEGEDMGSVSSSFCNDNNSNNRNNNDNASSNRNDGSSAGRHTATEVNAPGSPRGTKLSSFRRTPRRFTGLSTGELLELHKVASGRKVKFDHVVLRSPNAKDTDEKDRSEDGPMKGPDDGDDNDEKNKGTTALGTPTSETPL